MNRFQLKLTACASMLADHICRVFFADSFAAEIISQSIGRIAFPLFSYMLVRGFFHTKDRKKYGLSLLLTAVISEPFYDLALHGRLFYWKNQNVIFTLLLSLILLVIMDRLKEKPVLQLAIAAAFAAGAQLAHLDYGAAGVAVCVLFYYTASFPPYRSCVFACIPLLCAFGSIGAFLAVPVLALYTDRWQKLSAAWKIFFYVFYPLHLGLIAAILR